MAKLPNDKLQGQKGAADSDKSTKRRSLCPVSCSLDLIGDKWTLIIVRDLLLGDKTYGELQSGPEGIPTNILANRLKRLNEGGLIIKLAYQQAPLRYRYQLTEKGKELWPVIRELLRWGYKHLDGVEVREEVKQYL